MQRTRDYRVTVTSSRWDIYINYMPSSQGSDYQEKQRVKTERVRGSGWVQGKRVFWMQELSSARPEEHQTG